MKKQRKALTVACLLAFAATAWAAPETVVTNAPAAAQPVTVASAAPVAVVTVETVKDVNQFPAADQHPPVRLPPLEGHQHRKGKQGKDLF